jgi:hypothetical protein
MRSLSVLLALATLTGNLDSQVVAPQHRLYVEKNLAWEGKPWTGSGGLRASSSIEIFYPDHRYISAGVILGKETRDQKTPYILENEGFSLRAGTWSENGATISTHSKYVHLDAKVSPHPPPVDERFDAAGIRWAEHGGPLRSQGKVLAEVRRIRGMEHLWQVAIADSCDLKAHPNDLGDAWTAFCHKNGSGSVSIVPTFVPSGYLDPLSYALGQTAQTRIFTGESQFAQTALSH